MDRRSKVLVVGLALTALLGVGPARAARRPKGTISADVSGKHVGWRGRYVSFSYGASGLIAIATKVGATKTISFGCPILLEAQTYPVTMSICSGQYAQGRGVHKKYWFDVNTTQVTFDSFDGTVVQGSFTGTLAPLSGGATGPVTISGTFRGPIRR